MSKLMKCTNKDKPAILVVVGLFVISCAVYGIIALQMGSTRSGVVDEALYINMAKSFFYDQNFMRGAAPMGYDCVLYSIIISISYLFYSPENILSVMRLVNVIIMCSVVFPAYLLANKMFSDKRKVLFAVFLTVCIPSLTLTYYMYQETLLYPIVVLFLYFIYNTADSGKYRHQAIAGALIYAMYNTKTICIYILAAYMLYLLLDFAIFHKEFKRAVISILLVCAVFFSLYSFVKLGIDFLNGFQAVRSHYDSQISVSIGAFFSEPFRYIPQMLRSLVFYTYYTLLAVLAFPILIPLFNYKNFSVEEKKFLLLGLLCVIMAIVLISGGIFLLEDVDRTTPRFHNRYYFPFFIPFIFLFLKSDIRFFVFRPVVSILIAGLFSYPFLAKDGLLYFAAFVDNYLFSIFEAANQFLGDSSRFVIGMLLAVYSICVLLLPFLVRNKWVKLKDMAIVLLIFFSVANLTNSGIAIGYKATSEMEQQIDADTLLLAQYLASNDGLSIFVNKGAEYVRAINYNTRLREDYFFHVNKGTAETVALDYRVKYAILPKDINVRPINAERLELGLFTVSLYRLNNAGELILIEA